MKKILANLKIIIVILFLYLLTYNYFISLGYNTTIYNIIFWIIFLIFTYFLIGYTNNRSILKKQTIQYVIIYCIIYLLVIYFLGIVTGFNYSPFLHNLKSILKNIIPLITIIICRELIRYMIIFKGRFNKKFVNLVTLLFILIDIVTVINLYKFSTGLLIFSFIGEVILKSLYNNYLETIIAYNTGPIPNIVYRIILECYIYLVPIIPDLGIYLTTMVNIILPVLLVLKLNNINLNYKLISKKKVNISKKYITIPIFILLAILISLVSGLFRYKMIAVGSNSMLPIISKGDAVIYEKVSSIDKLNEDDILVFKNEGVIYIHRIVEISKKNKDITIYTKGDNNAMNDEFTTSKEEVIGVVKQKIKYIGYPTIWLSELFD
ncbi:MAG: signal peptidase I [bacterium]|nr:signal peptidase I [bacterium]